MTWVEMKMKEDDYETACYCEECFAEDERDNEYLGCFGIVY